MANNSKSSEEQQEAESNVESYREQLGPFVTATQMTRMPMVFLDATSPIAPIVFANDSFLGLMGYMRQELLGRGLTTLLSEDHSEAAAARLNALLKGNMPRTYETTFRRKDGTEVCVDIFASPVLDGKGEAIQYFVSLVDLTKYKDFQRELLESEQRFRLAANAAGLGVIDIDLTAGTYRWSTELRRIIGVTSDVQSSEIAYQELIHPDDRALAVQNYDGYMGGDGSKSDNIYRIIRPVDGEVRWIISKREVVLAPTGKVSRVVITIRDMTGERLAQENITWAATHDLVTGLPNRSLFRGQLESAISSRASSSDQLSLLLMDLDRFKDINDTLGHQLGDAALIGFAARVSASLGPEFLFARLGGDEFAVILPSTDKAGAAAIAQSLLDRIRPPFLLEERALDIRASIGISTFPSDGQSYSALLHSADLALYAAKEAGGSRFRAFTSVLRGPRRRQLSMIRTARSALDNGWIEPFYQPKVVLADGRVAGFEALLRLRHPRAGVQMPAKIACAFDDGHLAILLGGAMADRVLADLRTWIDRELPVGKIAINASPAELRDLDFARRLLARLRSRDIPAEKIELEITETALLDDRGGVVVGALQELRASGMTVALDDFGTGFSSLSHL